MKYQINGITFEHKIKINGDGSYNWLKYIDGKLIRDIKISKLHKMSEEECMQSFKEDVEYEINAMIKIIENNRRKK